MTDTPASLRRKIDSAGELQSVVRTMKAVAAASVGQYERSVRALGHYDQTVRWGLGAALRDHAPVARTPPEVSLRGTPASCVIIFGSDQGLVGQFNEAVVDFAIRSLDKHREAGDGPVEVIAVGERTHDRLCDAGLTPTGRFAVPTSVRGITPLVGEIQIASERHRSAADYASVHVIHNQPRTGAVYEPVGQRLLPLDAAWEADLRAVTWPTPAAPQIIGGPVPTLPSLIREHLFLSLFKACAESLASENASRLAAMQRADQNIDELLDSLNANFHRLRQNAIDEELFDVISGFEALIPRDAPGS